MSVHYADDTITLHHGDCLDVLRELPDNSVHAVCTDPPYGLGFMGRDWDTIAAAHLPPSAMEKSDPLSRTRTGKGPSAVAFDGLAFQQWCEQWATECLRVLTPGGHLLAFGGTRTWHRLACAVEDAGFEVRDSIAWLYGQGFPKSLNLARDQRFCQCGALDSWGANATTEHGLRGLRDADVPEAVGVGSGSRAVLLPGVPEPGAPADGCLPSARGAGQSERVVEGRGHAQAAAGELHRGALREVPAGVPADGTLGRLHHGAPAGHGAASGPDADALGSGGSPRPRPVEQHADEPGAVPDERGSQAERGWPLCARCGKHDLTGFGTALKPSFEPIVVARKPLTGTVAATVLAHGTGALNIDGTRVGTTDRFGGGGSTNGSPFAAKYELGTGFSEGSPLGRWPANVLLDGDQADALDAESGVLTSGVLAAHHARTPKDPGILGGYGSTEGERGYGDQDGASRFFPVFRWQAKAPTDERPRAAGVAHPTVKPLDLMRWLVRLVTPPGGTVLEPFAGSGTTVEACLLEGFRCIAIEREATYLPLIVERINRQLDPVAYHQGEAADDPDHDAGLFGLLKGGAA